MHVCVFGWILAPRRRAAAFSGSQPRRAGTVGPGGAVCVNIHGVHTLCKTEIPCVTVTIFLTFRAAADGRGCDSENIDFVW